MDTEKTPDSADESTEQGVLSILNQSLGGQFKTCTPNPGLSVLTPDVTGQVDNESLPGRTGRTSESPLLEARP